MKEIPPDLNLKMNCIGITQYVLILVISTSISTLSNINIFTTLGTYIQFINYF